VYLSQTVSKIKRWCGLGSAVCPLTFALVLLSGCASAPIADATTAQAEPDSITGDAVADDLPSVELDSELLYQLLVGELALQRGEFDMAARSLYDATEQARDYRLAERATRVALRARDFERARKSARIWAELRPQDTEPLEVIAMALVEEGDIDGARDVIVELMERPKEDRTRIYRRMAELLSRQPNREGALTLMSELVKLDPDNPEIHYARAYLADRLDEPWLVVESLDRALELDPESEDAALAKAAHLAGAEGQKDAVLEFCNSFLRDNPDAKRLRLYFARYLVDQGENKLGFEQFTALVEQDPDNADALYAAGLLAIELDRFEEAEKYLNANLELRPRNDQIRLYLGQLAIEREGYEEALEIYRTVQSESFYFEAQLSITDVLMQIDGTEAALAHLETLHPVNQDEYVRWVLMQEQVYRDSKQLDEAKMALDSAVERYPDDVDLLYARGLLAAQLDLIEVHEQDMRKLLVKDPQNAHALNALGYTLADATDRYEEAHTLIEQALSIRPDDPFILDSMGWVQYRLGNHNDAIEYLERALTKRDDAEIAAHLGEVLWVKGDQDRAREVWHRALEQNPENDVLLNTINKFEQ
jgi:tetratricopeptide (TPR) repeat protein